MIRLAFIAHTILAGFAILNLTTALKVTAAPATVTRGPHGAAFIIDSKTSATEMKTAKSSSEQMTQEMGTTHTMKSNMQAISVPKLINRGPNGASVIVNN